MALWRSGRLGGLSAHTCSISSPSSLSKYGALALRGLPRLFPPTRGEDSLKTGLPTGYALVRSPGFRRRCFIFTPFLPPPMLAHPADERAWPETRESPILALLPMLYHSPPHRVDTAWARRALPGNRWAFLAPRSAPLSLPTFCSLFSSLRSAWGRASWPLRGLFKKPPAGPKPAGGWGWTRERPRIFAPTRSAEARRKSGTLAALRSLWAGALSPARRRQDAGRGGPAHSMSPFSRPYALRGDGLLGRSAASSRNLPRVPNPREVGVGRRSVRESLPPRGAQGREGRAGRLRLRSLWAGALSPARRRQAAGRGGPAHSMRAPLSRTFQHVREGKARRRQGLDAAPAKGTRAGAMLSNALPLWTEREECV